MQRSSYAIKRAPYYVQVALLCPTGQATAIRRLFVAVGLVAPPCFSIEQNVRGRRLICPVFPAGGFCLEGCAYSSAFLPQQLELLLPPGNCSRCMHPLQPYHCESRGKEREAVSMPRLAMTARPRTLSVPRLNTIRHFRPFPICLLG